MTSRERIAKAIKHEETDRVPRDLGGTESSGMTAHSLHKLQEHLHIRRNPKVFEPYQYVAYIEDELRERFKIDTENLTPGPKKWVTRKSPAGFEVSLPALWLEETDADGETVVRREDGTISARRPAGGLYFDPVNPPLQNITTHKELTHHCETIRSFDAAFFADEPVERMKERAGIMHVKGACVVFNLCCHILAAGQLLRGYENFMIDLLSDEPMVRGLLDILLEGYIARVNRLAPRLSPFVDIVLLNDDLGTQKGPMLAPQLYRRLIKPYQRMLFSQVKRAFDAPILFHSCGAVREFIPDLIETGVDALNPVQISAEGMGPAELKRDFGKEITFWGGGVDTQSILNRQNPVKVKDSIRKNRDIFGPGGGFVFCQVHNIKPDVPPENVIAMFEALDQ